jgi:hypothetical protein
MSQIDTATVYEAIKSDVITAWNPAAVVYGHPQTEAASYPYAVIRLDSVPFDDEGIGTVEQTYNYEITLADLWPSTGNIELLKADRANVLIGLLTSAPNYHGFYDPRIGSVDFLEYDDDSEATYELTIRFSCSQCVRAIGV